MSTPNTLLLLLLHFAVVILFPLENKKNKIKKKSVHSIRRNHKTSRLPVASPRWGSSKFIYVVYRSCGYVKGKVKAPEGKVTVTPHDGIIGK